MRGHGDVEPDAPSLKAFVRERLSPHKTPAYWIWVKSWPLTGSGKIQKFKLREAFERGEFTQSADELKLKQDAAADAP